MTRDGHKWNHKAKLIMNIAPLMVCESKFMTLCDITNFYKLLKQFVEVCG